MERKTDSMSLLDSHASEYKYLSPELQKSIAHMLRRYPTRRAVVSQALWLIQDSYGCVPLQAQNELARYLNVPAVWIREVVSFYSMFHESPSGRYHIHFCGNLPCSLRGGRTFLTYLLQRLGLRRPGLTEDGQIEVEQVQCLGACEIAPVMQVNGEYLGPLDETVIDRWLVQARQDS